MGGKAARAGAETTVHLRAMLDEVVVERDSARDRLARIETSLEERERSFDDQVQVLSQAKEMLSAQFGEIGQKLLGEAQAAFLQRADERFNQAGEKNEERLKQLLAPVGERLKAYEDQVGKIEKDRTEAYGALTGLIDQMRAGQERVQTEAARLVNSLRNAPKARGRWGEQQLKNVLESCGLSEHVDFVTEQSVNVEDGRLRPDAIIRIPGGRSLVIDAKVSLNDYQDGFNADDDDVRELAMTRHTASMKNHVEGLSRKAYWDQFDDAPDYVIMFVPGEHFLAAALEHEPALWDLAFEKRVLLATPTNLVAIARTVASVWRQEGLAREAKQIGALGKEMYDRIAVAAGHLKSVGSGLSSAVNNYNKFVGSFERNVMSTGRKFAELNIETGKRELEDVPLVEALPRYSSEVEQELITSPEPSGED
ncbi:DNA recombination protein RmuC [Sphingorhabdus sp.]|uniref:DNA recombination protein RmuC n=3 Tax=Sphingorhabdus sp. TaxID=1902408 RepID=UPI003BAE6E3B|nr:DNA recombination protein RmuC [Sphingomonadales bacterium]MBK9433538.1 DNA recombination protein RmuC [Sphingomonadales bacterium]MBL0021761.1 DNA recombination protein RmuC [Sphingomonadales bacterium]